MRKTLLIALLLCLSVCMAFAEETSFAGDWFYARYAELAPQGVEAERTESAYTLTLADGRSVQSLCLTVSGDLRFGRYAQFTRTALFDAQTGEETALDAVFPDPDALQEFLDCYVEENVADELNTYLDAGDLLPVPLDTVSFDALGVTFHYPMERFQYFSGHAGAVQLQWYELAELLAAEPPEQPFPLLPGGTIDEALAAYGSLTDPDLVAGGELYEFESPALRGAQAVADADGLITAVRSARFCIRGVRPGTAREEAEALLGEAARAFPLESGAASGLRLRPGTAAQYPWEDEQTLTLYYDEGGLAYMAEVSLR